ncbi:MAG: Rdx family protein [Acidobacteria bacterium]|nr:Rdx family protein [Acidobacteriota bacterium]
MPRAAGLADAIREQLGLEAKLVKGRSGVFEVVLDGELIYSKKAEGRFPEVGEVEEALADLLAE